jgi:hypothetical protein
MRTNYGSSEPMFFGDTEEARFVVALVPHFGWAAFISYRAQLDYSDFARINEQPLMTRNEALDACENEVPGVVWGESRHFVFDQYAIANYSGSKNDRFPVRVQRQISAFYWEVKQVFSSREGEYLGEPFNVPIWDLALNNSGFDLVDDTNPILYVPSMSFQHSDEGDYTFKSTFDRQWVMNENYFWPHFDEFDYPIGKPQTAYPVPQTSSVELPPFLVAAADRIDRLGRGSVSIRAFPDNGIVEAVGSRQEVDSFVSHNPGETYPPDKHEVKSVWE